LGNKNFPEKIAIFFPKNNFFQKNIQKIISTKEVHRKFFSKEINLRRILFLETLFCQKKFI